LGRTGTIIGYVALALTALLFVLLAAAIVFQSRERKEA